MVHCWQCSFGTPGRGGYHNREWAEKMEEVGLMPSSTGEPGGREVGDRMSHYVIRGGAFDRACTALLAGGVRLDWQSDEVPTEAKRRSKRSKSKYTCGGCGLNAWAKPGCHLVCGDCKKRMAFVAG